METLQHTARRSPAATRMGFSLIEVILAIGVIAIAIVPMFGLLPAGLNTFRKTMDNTVSAQIAQQVMGEMQQTDFNVLENMSVDSRYFDRNGVEISDASHSQWVYRTIAVMKTPIDVGGTSSTSIGKVVIQVINDPAHKTQGASALVDETPGIAIGTYSSLVSLKK